MLRLGRIVIWICALELLWGIYVGTTQSTELIAGLIAAAIGAIFVEVLRARGLLEFTPSLRAVARARTVVPHVFLDFVLVLWVLVRDLAHGRRVRGRWLTAEYEDAPGSEGSFLRAMLTTLENETANGIVVDVDGGRALLHSLDTRVASGRDVL